MSKVELIEPETIKGLKNVKIIDPDKGTNSDLEIQNKLQLLKFTSEVQSRIRRDINSDFVLAKLDPHEKEAIIEMTASAYFFKRVAKHAEIKGRRWRWLYDNNGQGYWSKQRLSNTEKQLIQTSANTTFDTYMVRVYMTAILNRNVDANHLINKLSQYVEEEDAHKETAKATDLLSKIKTAMGPERESY